MLMIVAVIPKTILVATSVVLDEAEEDMLTGQVVPGNGADEWSLALPRVIERL